MQFVANGPNVPDRLIDLHADGDVVFFCGAGVSAHAGLPLFDSLTQRLFDAHGGPLNQWERDAITDKRFDVAIGLLEQRLPAGRLAVRRTVAGLLQPQTSAADPFATHRALLQLSRCPDGKHRLVTTNFDRLFHMAAGGQLGTIRDHVAPLLPIPKKRLDGIVFLHGLLPESSASPSLEELILSSGDFGLAYLVERWASRFVCELFRAYTVCFVGYSVDDPVMRYMLDALAADRRRGESPGEVFAFAPHAPNGEAPAVSTWQARNVTPITYSETGGHAALHRTLWEWASLYRDGISGKRRLIEQYAGMPPIGSSQEDDYVGRVLWALSDKSGAPARAFAKHEPLPPLEWLDHLADARFSRSDLQRFDAHDGTGVDENLRFSLASRPCFGSLAPWVSLIDRPRFRAPTDPILAPLSDWLVRHVENPLLVVRLGAERAEIPEPLRSKLVEAVGNTRDNRALTLLWRAVLANSGSGPSLHLVEWARDFERDPRITPASRNDLLQTLRPRLVLRRPYTTPTEMTGPDGDRPRRPSDIASWDLELATPHARHFIDDVSSVPEWADFLAYSLSRLTDLLHDALEMVWALSDSPERTDESFISRPSIADHPQNQHPEDWTLLIDLVRDAWIAASSRTPVAARLELERWRSIAFPLFRRLLLFAACHGNAASPEEAAAWLIEDDHRWIWAMECKREAIRLLVHIAESRNEYAWSTIERVLLAGPTLRATAENEELLRDLAMHATWLRLRKCEIAGAPLSRAARDWMDDVQSRNPDYSLAKDESDEFAMWSSAGEPQLEKAAIPRRYRDLLEWLKARPAPDRWREESWAAFSRRDVRRASVALIRLTRSGTWLGNRWSEALQAWSDEASRESSWRWIGAAVLDFSESQVTELARPLAWWLNSVAAHEFAGRERIEAIAGRLIAAATDERGSIGEDRLTGAINHPVGLATQAVFAAWFRSKPHDNDGLPPSTAEFLQLVASNDRCPCGAGCAIIGSNVVALFRVDPEWTKRFVIPLFDWQRSDAALLAWTGFLWTPRFLPSLMAILWPQLLAAPAHFGSTGKWSRQLAHFVGYIGMEQRSRFSITELRQLTDSLSSTGLAAIAGWIPSMLEDATDRPEEYFRNRVLPYFREVWPQDLRHRCSLIGQGIARICLASGGAFAEAVEALEPWLIQGTDVDLVVAELLRKGIAQQYPLPALRLLDCVVHDDAADLYSDFANCLSTIETADPGLVDRSDFRRLRQISIRLGLEEG